MFAGGEGSESGLFDGGPFVIIVATQVFDETSSHRSVFIAIEADVSFEVILEAGELAVRLSVELIDDALEDIREEVFASEGEGGGDGGEVVRFDGLEGFANKVRSCGGNRRLDQGVWPGGVLSEHCDERVDALGVGFAFLHRAVIEIVVAGEAAIEVLVALFGEDDFVDHAAAEWIGGRDPGNGGAADGLLKGFQK